MSFLNDCWLCTQNGKGKHQQVWINALLCQNHNIATLHLPANLKRVDLILERGKFNRNFYLSANIWNWSKLKVTDTADTPISASGTQSSGSNCFKGEINTNISSNIFPSLYQFPDKFRIFVKTAISTTASTQKLLLSRNMTREYTFKGGRTLFFRQRQMSLSNTVNGNCFISVDN